MKAAVHAFTLSAELNSGQTGYESAPVSGKKTGNMLTAAEWNRMLEIISQGTVGGGGDKFTFLDTQILLYSSGVTTSDKNTPIALDISSIAGVTIPTNAKAVQLYVICSSFSSQNENVRLNLGRSPTTMLRVCQQNVSGATNSDDTNSTILPLADDKKTLYYSYNVPASGSG